MPQIITASPNSSQFAEHLAEVVISSTLQWPPMSEMLHSVLYTYEVELNRSKLRKFVQCYIISKLKAQPQAQFLFRAQDHLEFFVSSYYYPFT